MMLNLIAAEGPNGRFLPSDIKEFWWSTAAFLIVMSLIIWKLLPMIKKAMSDRSDRIRDGLVEAERARIDAEAELSALRSKLGDADAEAARIVEAAHEQADTVKADLIARADAEAADAKEKAAIEVTASTGQASADIQAAVAAQAAAAAESVVTANLDQSTHVDLIDRYIEQVSGS
jgi:F-type H+-transporting ATPase subunit b